MHVITQKNELFEIVWEFKAAKYDQCWGKWYPNSKPHPGDHPRILRSPMTRLWLWAVLDRGVTGRLLWPGMSCTVSKYIDLGWSGSKPEHLTKLGDGGDGGDGGGGGGGSGRGGDGGGRSGADGNVTVMVTVMAMKKKKKNQKNQKNQKKTTTTMTRRRRSLNLVNLLNYMSAWCLDVQEPSVT